MEEAAHVIMEVQATNPQASEAPDVALLEKGLDLETLVVKLTDEQLRENPALGRLRDIMMGTLAEEKALADATEGDKTAPRPARTSEVEVVGNVPAVDLENLKAKYGDSLVRVTQLDMNDPQASISSMGFLHQGMGGTFREITGRALDFEMDPTLIALYDANVSGMPEIPFKPETDIMRIVNSVLGPDQEEIMRHVWKTPDDRVVALLKGLEQRRTAAATSEAVGDSPPINLMRPLPQDISVAHAYDSVTNTHIHALCFLQTPANRYVQGEMTARLGELIVRSLAAYDEATLKKARYLRIAWNTPVSYQGRIAYYVSATPFASDLGKDVDAIDDIARGLADMNIL